MSLVNKRLSAVALRNVFAVVKQLIIALNHKLLNKWHPKSSCSSSRWPLEGDSGLHLKNWCSWSGLCCVIERCVFSQHLLPCSRRVGQFNQCHMSDRMCGEHWKPPFDITGVSKNSTGISSLWCCDTADVLWSEVCVVAAFTVVPTLHPNITHRNLSSPTYEEVKEKVWMISFPFGSASVFIFICCMRTAFMSLKCK